MNGIIAVVNWLLPLLYLVLLIDYGATFFLRIQTHARNPWLCVVIAIHLGFLVLRGIMLGYPPLTTADEILSAIALSTTMLYLVLELVGGDRRAGSFVFLLVFLFQYTSSVILGGPGATADVHESVMQGWARLHVAPAILAYTALSVSGVYGLLHVVSQRNLKQHHFGTLFDRLPPLDLLGRMTWWALLVGFGFVTVSIVSGPLLFSLASSAGARPVLETKVMLKIIMGSATWIICLVAVLGKCYLKKPMTWVSGVAVTGFVVIMAILISSILLS